MLAKKFGGNSVLVWALAMLPWAWIIPVNAYFFDDWGTVPLRSWHDHVERWQGYGKHYLNPVMYFLLTPLGPWIFHVAMVVSIVGIAASLASIVSTTKLLPPELNKWVGPICLAMPVFDARFATSVLEYCLGLSAVLLAWRMFLKRRSFTHEVLAVALLVYAIGVPSLAILFGPMWLHIVSRHSSAQSLKGRVSSGLRFATILAIPIFYVPIFQTTINSNDRFGPSIGGIFTFLRGLLVVAGVGGALLLILWRRNRGKLATWLIVVSSGTAAYCGFFPYYATGYSPFEHLFIWRDIRPEFWMTWRAVPVTGVLLSTIWLLVTSVRARHYFPSAILSGLPVMTFVIVFGTSSFSLGPFGWESRHYLIFWPFVTITVLALIATSRQVHQQTLAIATFVTLLVATLGIASEYLADSILQRSLVSAVAVKLDPEPASVPGISYVIVVEPSAELSHLRARGRGADANEWRGLIAEGLGVEPWSMRLLHLEDFASQSNLECAEPITATYLRPEALSSRLEVLTRLRVRIELNARTVSVCDTSENFPWWSNESPLADRSTNRG